MAELTEKGKQLYNKLLEAEKSGLTITDEGRNVLARLKEAQGIIDQPVAQDKQQPEQSTFSRIAEIGSEAVTPPEQPKQGFFKSLLSSAKDYFVPSKESAKRLMSPVAGQFGMTRPLEQAGQAVNKAVESSVENLPETIGKKSPTSAGIFGAIAELGKTVAPGGLTPSSFQSEIGKQAIAESGQVIKPVVKAVDKYAIAPIQKMLTGISGKEWIKLSEDISILKPSLMGGTPPKEIAGEAIGKATEEAGLFKPLTPDSMSKSHADKLIDKATAGVSKKILSDPDAIKALATKLSPQEAYELQQGISKGLNSWVEGKNKDIYRTYTIWKEAANEYMDKVAPAIRRAQEIYADSAQREKFLSLLPRDKYGNPSIGRLGFAGAAMGTLLKFATNPMYAVGAMSATSPIVNTGLRVAGNIGTGVATSPAVQSIGLRAIVNKQLNK